MSDAADPTNAKDPKNEKAAWLVFDVETVVDGRLVQRVRYPDEPGLTPAEAVTRHRAELSERSGSDFIPHTFHLPISIAVAKVAKDHSLIEVRSLDRPKFRPQVIARSFWRGWEKHGQPTLVTFNGRFFDLPVLEMCAYRYGLSVPHWFGGSGYNAPRNRFNTQAHFDIQDVLTNAGATKMSGGLNLCAQLVGKPGKMGTKGSMVQELWERGEHLRIDDYCQCDALDTYFVFLRTRLIQGFLTLDQERALVEHAKHWIELQAQANPAMAEYLLHFRHWEAYGDDDAPFVR